MDGQIPWSCTGDLQHFRKRTLAQTVIMGRVTWESIGCVPLAERNNIVVTSKAADIHLYGVTFAPNLLAALREARKFPGKETFIIGGEQLYKEAMPLADTIILTRVDKTITQTGRDLRYFPEIYSDKWELSKMEMYDGFCVDEWHRIGFDW
jgi:dihydrofolate reductase